MSCHFCKDMKGSTTQNYSGPLFTYNELNAREHEIFNCKVSEFALINSRCIDFSTDSIICSHHRRMLCEDFEPKKRCSTSACYIERELIQMGVLVALVIQNVPIRMHIYMKTYQRS